MSEFYGSCHTGTETDAVICTGYIVIHGLGNSYAVYAFLVQAQAIAEGVIPSDRHQVFNSEVLQVFYDFICQIIYIFAVIIKQEFGYILFGNFTGFDA